jgi:MscS family membrane protein
MQEWYNRLMSLDIIEGWNNSTLAITLVSLLVWGLWRVLYSRLTALTQRTKIEWDELLIGALKTPISMFILLWPALISLEILFDLRDKEGIEWLSTTKHLLVIATFIWIIIRLVTNFEFYVLTYKKRDETTVQAISKVVRLFFIVMGIMSAMQTIGLSLSGLLTFGGVGGLIVGLAAKDLLSNFFGGLMIYFDRPFKVGDWIRSPDRAIEGTVERIGWRMTIIRTFDKRPLYVPNSVFSSIVVENPSRMQNRRIYETIGIRYDDGAKLALVVADVKAMLEQHPDIDTDQTMIVNFNAFGASSLDFFIYTFTKTVNWQRFHEVKQDVLLQVMAIIHQHGADIAYPTQTIKMDLIPPIHALEK